MFKFKNAHKCQYVKKIKMAEKQFKANGRERLCMNE